MNLLFLNSIDRQTYGGMEEWMRLVATGMVSRGHAATIAGRTGSEFLKRIQENHTEIDVLPMNISGDFHPATITKIKKEIKSRAIDAIVVNFNKDVRLGGLAARIDGQTRVIWSVGLDITRDKLVHRLLTPKLIDGVMVPSQSLKQQICHHGYIDPDMVEVVPIGIPEDGLAMDRHTAAQLVRTRFKLKKESIVCVTSGRFVEQKGHKYLIDAAPEIIKNHPNVVFLLLGDGELEPRLKRQTVELGISDSVVFAGMLSDVREVLPGCDVMIHPSIEEPFGIAILEGMRAGLPVIASRTGGIPEVVAANETAILIEPGQSGQIISQVIDLLGSPDRMTKMGAAGKRRWQTEFSYAVMIERVEKYLLEHKAVTKAYGQT